jgi:hypothetical protein
LSRRRWVIRAGRLSGRGMRLAPVRWSRGQPGNRSLLRTPASSRRIAGCPWRALRKTVVLERVSSGLNLRHGLPVTHVIQPTERAQRVRVRRSRSVVSTRSASRLTWSIARRLRRALHLARESGSNSCTHEDGCKGRSSKHSSLGHINLHVVGAPLAPGQEPTELEAKRSTASGPFARVRSPDASGGKPEDAPTTEASDPTSCATGCAPRSRGGVRAQWGHRTARITPQYPHQPPLSERRFLAQRCGFPLNQAVLRGAP